jgi:protein phosphatase
VALEPGDIFLLCTDGVTDGLYDATMRDLLKSPTPDEAKLNPALRIVQGGLERSGRDNTTAMVVEVRGAEIDS